MTHIQPQQRLPLIGLIAILLMAMVTEAACTASPTPIAAVTAVSSPAPTSTQSIAPPVPTVPTQTPTSQATSTATPTLTFTPTSTPTVTPTASRTATLKPTRVPPTPTSTAASNAAGSTAAASICTVVPADGLTNDHSSFNSQITRAAQATMCLIDVETRPDGSIQLNLAWTADLNGTRFTTIMVNPDGANAHAYLVDNLGNHYSPIELSGPARDPSRFIPRKVPQTAVGWYVFPVPQPGATSFTLRNDVANWSLGGIVRQ